MSMTMKAARVNKGYNLDEAANIIGVTPQTLSKWENGKTFPNVPYIIKIEQAYEITFNDLIFLPDESN